MNETAYMEHSTQNTVDIRTSYLVAALYHSVEVVPSSQCPPGGWWPVAVGLPLCLMTYDFVKTSPCPNQYSAPILRQTLLGLLCLLGRSGLLLGYRYLERHIAFRL